MHFGLQIQPGPGFGLLHNSGCLADPVKGWGRAEETWNNYNALMELGAPTWFQLGDKDWRCTLGALAYYRRAGLSAVTRHFVDAGVTAGFYR